jgi:hypothetical protein
MGFETVQLLLFVLEICVVSHVKHCSFMFSDYFLETLPLSLYFVLVSNNNQGMH